MIKTSVVGAASPLAGELIRILIHHPEVEVKSLYAPQYAGLWVGARHPGLVGDTDLRFADHLDIANTDVLILCSDTDINISSLQVPRETKVIILDGFPMESLPDMLKEREYVSALSELFRKPLVRGAINARTLNPAVAVVAIALFPLALHLMLNDSMKLSCSLPYWILRRRDKASLLADVNHILSSVQLSFKGLSDASFSIGKDSRAVFISASMPCGVSLEEIKKLYEGVYDDHNFTFLVDAYPDRSEVLGTQKCLIHLSKPSPDILQVEAVADGVYRGGVGDAVHALNLLFGLFEKIGLSFKAAAAFKESYDGC